MNRRRIPPVELDRAAGAVLGSAFGDALGAGYEFAARAGAHEPVVMRPGTLTGNPAGHWTDDTELAICVLGAAAGGELTSTGALDAVASRFAAWFAADPPDAGLATVGALSGGARTADEMVAAARAYLSRNGRGAGNGSLMRTHAVPLAYLDRPAGADLDVELAAAARAISELTHADPYTGDACVLWSFAVDRAIRAGSFDGLFDGFDHIPEQRRRFWELRAEEALTSEPEKFNPNGYVADTYCAAMSSVAATADVAGPSQLWAAVDTAVRIGDDTDTVAAVTGALTGARWGASAIPAAHRRVLRGWPGMDAGALVRVAVSAAAGGNDPSGWPGAENMCAAYARAWDPTPFVVPLPSDPGVLLGNVFALDSVTADAVVSLCRVGRRQLRDRHLEVWLVDSADPAANPNGSFVVADTADAVAALRAEGATVFIHCVEGRSRTPTVAAAYMIRHLGHDPAAALAELESVLPRCEPNRAFLSLLATVDSVVTEPQRRVPAGLAAFRADVAGVGR